MDDHASPPLYKQISALILREIMAGRLVDGEKLAPERDMADQFGTSVGTLRKALADLDGQGVLERVQGSGNYIKASAELSGIYSFFRLELPGGGGLPTALVLSVDKGAPPEAFQLGETGHRIRRQRNLDGQPVAIEEIWLAGDRAETVSCADLSDSLYHYYKARLGLWIARVEDRVGVAPIPGWGAAGLGRSTQTMMGHVTRIGWAQDGRRAEGSFTWFHPELCHYTNRMT
ncbi:GntR family transcriptional regulator [Actibacterium sp. 188UL27-1]|uniref:GntR family transcriptional regulator n=1 Tax=Actibacterium sp. 188UL27-1 TaxID=2786961 RepID=UPI00195B9C35|nr:GntR family transcriptional regulator [Actibacterium sp. 188UL27-1]MBM7068438.1 GntR family transcriptional regulator [Actibacterium sp. 188UL27-1]